ncbi:hypothetical protein CLV58_11085 [Spirosoma oryzae]|uniref:Spy/CpxP family protein refolding chaperone n=1 Tax=Spirosoma oryzae TaxID=1469603 RepID=A0A2T0SW26_9BACT|nr:DUF4890 domain-containing protein [Spirosoma oryzae]PRY37616.1 hypothetical protein CLV58_11085 [Spirosoma oryzae]
MFTKLAYTGLLCSLLSLPLLAQQAPMSTVPHQQGTKQGQKMADPTIRAQRMADRLTKELGLDQATSQKVYTAALARAQKIDNIQASPDDNRTKAKALKANADDFKAQLKSMLTPDQFTKFESMRGRMRGGRGGMGRPDSDTDQP